MSYDLDLANQAASKLKRLDRPATIRILKKLGWLADNAAIVEHERLTNPPPGLTGVCKYRIGPYRVIYWIEHVEEKFQSLILCGVVGSTRTCIDRVSEDQG